MIPLRDVDSRARGMPATTLGLLAANLLVFLLMSAGGEERFTELTWRYAVIPRNIMGGESVRWEVIELGSPGRGDVSEQVPVFPTDDEVTLRRRIERVRRRLAARGVRAVPVGRHLEGQALPAWLTLFTSMFMHGGLAHILGNMLFLWVFGQRLEYRMGGLRFLVFYLLTGVLAGLSHVLLSAESVVPTVGASGAISGLLGGYLLLFPHGRILTLIPIFILIHLVELPAYLFIAIWAVYQLLLVGEPGSVAVWAHLGGFVFGLLLIRFFAPAEERRRPHQVRPWGGSRPDLDWFRE